MIRTIAVGIAAGLVCGCSEARKLAKTLPEATISLPGKAVADEPPPADTARAPQIVSFKKQDGTEVFFAPAELDSLSGERLMSVAIDEVVISAGNRRNLVERNGNIQVEFIITVPSVLFSRDWELALEPQLVKGADTLPMAPLIYSGDRFRAGQKREYARFEAYRKKIVDSADYFEKFGDKLAYDRSIDELSDQLNEYVADYERMERMSPRDAAQDARVGWVTPQEQKRRNRALRRYTYSVDRKMARRITYRPDSTDRFDHLVDYFTPRYTYSQTKALPGGKVYTRVNGDYPDETDRRRAAYMESLAKSRSSLRRRVKTASDNTVSGMASDRESFSGLENPSVRVILREVADSSVHSRYKARKELLARQIDIIRNLDTNRLKQSVLDWDKVARNRRRDERSEEVFARLVRNPYVANPRLDTVIHQTQTEDTIRYHYVEQIPADENTSKLRVFLAGSVGARSGEIYRLHKSDTLIYNVASMTTFLDTMPRYVQRIVLRDAEANARFFFTFPTGKSTLENTLSENRRQIAAVRALTRDLMTDPVYIIENITLRATSSPEGSWQINDRLARERAEALRRVLVSEFRVLYDSLRVAASFTVNDQGEVVMTDAVDELPHLPHLLQTEYLAEDWQTLRRMIVEDGLIANKQGVLRIIDGVKNPDLRERKIRSKYPVAYRRMREVFYPQMRAVDFRFELKRRGMQQDTIYTTEIDEEYMYAVELLRKRRYEEALTILRPYEDRNTALAYMSLGYDAAAYRILKAQPNASTTADVQYMLAILAARLGDEEQAVRYFLRSVELRANLKFRGNLDPEISRLIRRYGLFKEDFM